MAPGLTYTAFFFSVGRCLATIAIYASLRAINYAMSTWLGKSLSYAINKSLIKKWTKSKFFYGIKFLPNADNSPNASKVLGEDVHKISSRATNLADNFLSTFLSFIVGLYELWNYSVGLSLTLFGLTLPIPGYMALGAIGYALGHHFLVHYMGKSLKSMQSALRTKMDNLTAYLHHVEMHGESIALKGGANREKNGLLHSLKESSLILSSINKTESTLTFISTIHNSSTFCVGLILAAPGFIKGKLLGTEFYSIGDYFSAIVSMFSWKDNNFEDITYLEVSFDRFTAFQKLMQEWERVNQQQQLMTQANGKNLKIENFILKTPNGDPITDNAAMEFNKGKVTLLQGPSGIGKTTLLKSLAGLWPYVQGNLTLPVCGKEAFKIHYIPQTPHFAYRATLLETITYPEKTNLSKHKKNEIIQLMRDLGIKPQTIQEMNTKKSWEQELSGGEQQRIAIISAIYHKPDILFMDEATNALDHATRELVEACLKRNLPNSTIVVIDHNAQAESPVLRRFYDNHLLFSQTSKAKTPQQAQHKDKTKSTPRSKPKTNTSSLRLAH